VPKIIKVGGHLTKLLQKKICAVFLRQCSDNDNHLQIDNRRSWTFRSVYKSG